MSTPSGSTACGSRWKPARPSSVTATATWRLARCRRLTSGDPANGPDWLGAALRGAALPAFASAARTVGAEVRRRALPRHLFADRHRHLRADDLLLSRHRRRAAALAGH